MHQDGTDQTAVQGLGVYSFERSWFRVTNVSQ
jgi:hypothetical protein